MHPVDMRTIEHFYTFLVFLYFLYLCLFHLPEMPSVLACVFGKTLDFQDAAQLIYF